MILKAWDASLGPKANQTERVGFPMIGYHMSRCDTLLFVRVDVVRSFVLALPMVCLVSKCPGCMKLCVYVHDVLHCSGCITFVLLATEDFAHIRDPEQGAIMGSHAKSIARSVGLAQYGSYSGWMSPLALMISMAMVM